MDSTRRNRPPSDRGPRGQDPGGRLALKGPLLALAVLAGCSGITENADGIATLDVRLPANLFLEVGASVTLQATARDANGEAVDATIRFLTGDTTITVGESNGVVTARVATGTGRVQVVAFGEDSVASRLDTLRFTLTARADTLVLPTDSVDVTVDTLGTALTAVLRGGTPLRPVEGRPITFRLVTPAAGDSTVLFANHRGVDSATTTGAGQATVRLRGIPRRSVPDRAVVDVSAFRANGQAIAGSSRRIVVRFRHQNP